MTVTSIFQVPGVLLALILVIAAIVTILCTEHPESSSTTRLKLGGDDPNAFINGKTNTLNGYDLAH